MSTTATGPSVSERLITALTRAWAAIRDRHPDVPDVVITLASGTIGMHGKGVRMGHFADHRWRSTSSDESESSSEPVAELFIGAEGLKLGPEQLLATLLHEAAHGVASTRAIQDTSRRGSYHNKRFRQLGEELGLTITEDGNRGWSGTELGPATAASYRPQLDMLAKAITSHRDDEVGDQTTSESSRNNAPLTCACPRKIRASKKALALGPILCGVCGQPFTEQDTEDA